MSVLVEYSGNPEILAKSLTKGARHALLRMTEEWHTASEGMFRANGARYLWEASKGLLCERDKNGKASSQTYMPADRYRLTPLGVMVWEALVDLGLEE